MRLAVILELIALAGTLALSNPPLVRAQGQTMVVGFVSSTETTPYDDALRGFYEDLRVDLASNELGFPYSSVDYHAITYHTACSLLSRGAIVTLSPLKYIECKASLGDGLIPLFVMRKRHEPAPYYNAFFVVNRGSPILSIHDKAHIHTLLLVDSNSTSGYLAPLYKLYEEGLVSEPTESAVRRELGWEIRFTSEQRNTRLVESDVSTLAAVGGFRNQDNPSIAPVRVVLRYQLLPQDVLVITRDLEPYRNRIADWFMKTLAHDPTGKELNPRALVLERSSTSISGVVPFSEEHQNAYQALAILRDRVRGFKEAPLILPSVDLTVNQVLQLIGHTSLRAMLKILAVLLFYSLLLIAVGHRWGAGILSFARTMKRLLKDPTEPVAPAPSPRD